MSPVLKPFYTILDTKRDFWHKKFQTQLDARPACTDANTETSKYGPSGRCLPIQLLCSFWIKSRAEGDPGTSQLARGKSLQAWMHSNATPHQSPGRSSFPASRAKHIILIQYGLHYVNHNAWIIISLDIFVPGSVSHCVGSVLSVPFLLHSLHFIIVADQ